ncbi:MAG: Prepilin-type cleavage/methylation protein [Candidatus Kaiserbacteria bacterium GW2011_GWB1_52_6]|uniref:Prepilin-type cleavage/methylation protein n=2 Tax=Candidatus Kaiseribacteriota TaxID=1752734 RepID=A0A0G1ZEK9_9BACT|nr:MAG: Prepilin-type cleavage/methylation protein [Candidatus Kaiserbacteria bacterium GW2011_GWA2_52_12]KKW26292.1 MAG: Prepilin-type cleavage/methylation protein [Candidatus Kaiserbacteria bacterium GW2011_GWB1_52_6]
MKSVQKQGFTLIELLVVIAIIGLLASIILVSLNSARNKGKDTRIISDAGQVRTQIETEASTGGAYTSSASACVTATDTINATSGNCNTLRADAATNGGAVTVKATVASGAFSAYAVYGQLVTDSTKYFCVDSTGKTTPAATAATTVVCP